MITVICIVILYCLITGKDIKPLVAKLKNVDWQKNFAKAFTFIKKYAIKAGRIATKPLLQCYYVLTDSETTIEEKAMMYGCILYVVLPFSLIPRAAHKILGLLDEGAALLFVIKKVEKKLTPEINAKVENTLNDWFGTEYEIVK